ncbi:MAG: lysine 2,3-aminomutase [Desulfuromonas sp.]|nr:MAG: lysine 2,3-aminomutase [Desulfuromonas sp.]
MSIYSSVQQKIAERINDGKISTSKWTDWQWQLRHVVTRLETFEKLLGIELEPDERRKAEQTLEKFPLAVTPYYLSLIDRQDYLNDPIFRQSFPNAQELEVTRCDIGTPPVTSQDKPVSSITHRYPDRAQFHVSNVCAMYCRHCTHKRRAEDTTNIPHLEQVHAGLDYLRSASEVRDVLITGGDPLMLKDAYLDWLLTELREIEHIQIIRIGTRIPAVLPYRVTDELVATLKKHHPVWLNTHFNHPREISTSSRQALSKLADAGIPLGNESVLLSGVNDCPRIIKSLVHKLVENRVRPYYLYQCDLSEGLSHFRTPVGKGIEIMESLIGHTSGYAVPTFVIDAPGGGGKIPLGPNYLISLATNKVVLRNYEGVITTYKEPDKYEEKFCDRKCDQCELHLNLEYGQEMETTGIEKLLSDHDETISLTPSGNERLERQNGNRSG